MSSEPDCNFLKKVSCSIEEICNTLSDTFSGKKLCVALSGGADSTALLISLHMLQSKFGYILCAAHVNHLLRGEEATRDEEFCIDLCKKLNIELFKIRIDIKKQSIISKKSIEETARDARYSYFKDIEKQNNIDYFVTAHTKNDNTETIYMHIIRGTTTSGLCGIPQINGNIIRPLLHCSREENIAFLSNNGYSYVTDSSNNDNTYTRNYIRNVILPATRRINPKSIEAAETLCAYAKTDEDYFDSIIKNIPKGINDSELHPAILRRKLQRDYSAISNGKSLMTVHLDAIMRLVSCKQNKSISMPNGILAVYKDGSITFKYKNDTRIITDNGIYELKNSENSFADGLISIHLLGNNSLYERNIYNNYTHTKLYFGNIVGRVKYRSRRPGDKILCLGVNKSLKKEFIAKGIPVHIREAIPIFFDDEGIVYVPFIGAADRVYAPTMKNDEDTFIITVRIKERQDG